MDVTKLRETFITLNRLEGDNCPFGSKEEFKKAWVLDQHEMTGVPISYLEMTFDSRYEPNTFTVNNTRDGKQEERDGIEFLDYIFRHKAVRTEGGVYFENHQRKDSPSVLVWRELVEGRGKVKKKMFVAAEKGDKVLAEYFDMQQKFIKLVMNTFKMEA